MAEAVYAVVAGLNYFDLADEITRSGQVIFLDRDDHLLPNGNGEVIKYDIGFRVAAGRLIDVAKGWQEVVVQWLEQESSTDPSSAPSYGPPGWAVDWDLKGVTVLQ